jgi:hypothetical protein
MRGYLPVERIIRVGRRLGHEEYGASAFVVESDMAESFRRMVATSNDG